MAGTKPSSQITEGVIWKQLLIFFFPILLGTFFQQMYNTVDTIIVGRFVGTQALAAVGSTSALVNLINGFFMGLSTGASVVISQFFGAGDRGGVRRSMGTNAVLALILGILATLIGISGSPGLLKLIKTPQSCLSDAALYAKIYFCGAAATVIYNMGSGILRAMGDSKRPLYFLIVTCFSNIALDLLFVVVLKQGIAGAAYATVLSQIASAILVVITLCRLEPDIRLDFKNLYLDSVLLRRILLIGIPAGLQFITFDLSNLLVQSGINSFGEVTTAAWTAFAKADGITWMVSGAFGVSITTFVGQNFGAQKYSRIRQSVRTCLAMSIATQLLLSTCTLVFRVFILGIYTADAEVIRVGAYAMLWIVPFNALFMFVEVFAGTMRGTGCSVTPTVITGVCICGFRILWVLFIVSRWHTIEMLCITYPLSWIFASVVFAVTYLRGTWLRRRIEACGMEPERI